MDSYLLTATEVVTQLQDDSLTVEQYAQSLLAHIKQRDPTIMAWAHLDPEYVIEQARILDQTPAQKRGPLHGVAIAIKDVIYTKRKSKMLPKSSFRACA
jgi:amidase